MVRKAKLTDAKSIFELVSDYALKGVLLPRSIGSIYDRIRDFWVYEESGCVVGCVALQVVWEDLAEIRSFAVKKEKRGRGIGKKLIEACLEEAHDLGIRRVFSLTYAKEYFEKMGFRVIDKGELPHKIWSDCVNCSKFPACDEIAVVFEFDECGSTCLHIADSHEVRRDAEEI